MRSRERTDCSNVHLEGGPGAAKTDPTGLLNSHGTAAVRIAEGFLNGVITRDVSVLSNREMGCLAFRLYFETGQFHL